MKVVNIFGVVVAVHVVVLLLIFAIPGCRTTTKTPDRSESIASDLGPTPSPTPSAAPVRPVREFSSDLNPPLATNGSYANIDAPSVASGGRASPTRPGSSAMGDVPTPITPTPMPAPVQTYTVVRNDSLWSVAKKHGISVRELAAANHLSESASLKIDQTLTIPARKTELTGSASTPKSANGGASGAASEPATYVVKAGDTLGAIAKRHNTTVGAIKAMNSLRSDLVRVGDTLQIPQAAVASSNVPAPAATPPPPSASAPAPSASRPAANSVKHIVAPGETLSDIAKRYGVRIGDIGAANNIDRPNQLAVGRELTIPNPQIVPNSTPKAPEPTRYTPSYQPGQSIPAASDTLLPTPPPEDNVPVIRVEEPVQTIRIEPAPKS